MATMEEIKKALAADGLNFSDEQLKAIEGLVNNPPAPGEPMTDAQLELISGGGIWQKIKTPLIAAGIITTTVAAAYGGDQYFNEGKGWEATKDYAGKGFDAAKGYGSQAFDAVSGLAGKGLDAAKGLFGKKKTTGGDEETLFTQIDEE